MDTRLDRTACRTFKASTGFTLLEVLMVVTVVAILAGAVVLNYSGRDHLRNATAEAERLMLAIELARSEVTVRNEIWGLHLSDSSYSFSRNNVDENVWELLDEAPFGPATIRDAFRLIGNRVNKTRETDLWAGSGSPFVVLYPSGEITPFHIVFESTAIGEKHDQLNLISDGIQRVRLVRDMEIDEREESKSI